MTGLLLVVVHSPMDLFPSSGAELLATPTVEPDPPFVMIAGGSGAGPGEGSDVVWLVQRGTASGDQHTEPALFPLGFVLVERGTLVIFDADKSPLTELGSGRATLLPEGERGSFGSANGDVVLYAQISLVPVTAAPDTLPPGRLVSEPFPTADSATLSKAAQQPALPNPASGLPQALNQRHSPPEGVSRRLVERTSRVTAPTTGRSPDTVRRMRQTVP